VFDVHGTIYSFLKEALFQFINSTDSNLWLLFIRNFARDWEYRTRTRRRML